MFARLKKTEGQQGVLRVRLTGWADGAHACVGAIQVGSGAGARSYPMAPGTGGDGMPVLTAPTDLPVGLHLMEVQVDGETVVYCHVEVLPGPVGGGVANWLAEVPAPAVQTVGSGSANSEDCEHGDCDHTSGSGSTSGGGMASCSCVVDQTYQPYSANAASGNALRLALEGFKPPTGGSGGAAPSAEEVAEALLPMIGTEMALEGPPGSNNWHVGYFELGSAYLVGGMLLEQFGYRCRFDTMESCATMPVYLGVWEQSADGASWVRLGASINTQEQGINTDVMWSFEPGALRLSGRPLRFGLLESREDDWRNDLTMGMRVSLTSDTQTKIHYNGSTWTYVPKFFLLGLKMPDNIALGGGLQLVICDSEAEAKNASADNPGGLYATVE